MDEQLLVEEVSTQKSIWQRKKVYGVAAFVFSAAGVRACIGSQRSVKFIPAPAILDTPVGNVPYIIVNKNGAQGMMDAELSWDGGSPHPMASVEFHDPVDWGFAFHPSSGGYRITSLADQQGEAGNSLSWDGQSYGNHAMASVECCDHVDWALRPSVGSYFRIVNLNGGQGMMNAELSWDGQTSGSHAMASVEFHDPVDWAIVPSYSIFGQWIPKQTIHAEEGTTVEFAASSGAETSTSWSQTSTFEESISATISATPGSGGGMFGGVTAEASHSLATVVSQAVSTTSGETITQHFGSGFLWQWQVTVQNNHYGKGTVTALIPELALTQNMGQRPRCAPSFCEDQFCQNCQNNGTLST